jgi:RNA polymerase sigma factor (TIGR02999 family)
MTTLTGWFSSYQAGNRAAFDRIYEALYPELTQLARSRLRRGARMTLLDTSALVHECYLRFLRTERVDVDNREHFLAYCTRVMRSIIVDFARARHALRRGGDLERVPLDTDGAGALPEPEDRVIELAEAIDALARLDERLAQTMEMRLFGGFGEGEIAAALGISDRTVRRDLEKGRMLLAASLR